MDRTMSVMKSSTARKLDFGKLSEKLGNARAKVQPGLHPQSKKEAFDIFMYNITQFVLLYTNQEGRRIAAEKLTEWKRLTEEELQAFLGLHLLSGKPV